MGIERKLIPCEPDDPNRCQAMGMNKEGQCKFLAVEGQKNCPAHQGLQMAARADKAKLHDYRLRQWQDRLNEFSESENEGKLVFYVSSSKKSLINARTVTICCSTVVNSVT